MFIRVKTITKYRYAYLVESIWKNGKTKQRVKKYLGKVLVFEDTKPLTHTTKNTLITDFLEQLGFTQQKAQYIYNTQIAYATKTTTLTFTTTKPAVIQVNEGFVCTVTLRNLKKLLEKAYVLENQQDDITTLATALIDCGIRLDKKAFISLYSELANIAL